MRYNDGSNLDKNEFDAKIAMSNTSLAILLTVGGVLASAGIAFLIAGAIEVNHGIDLPEGESQNRILNAAFRFLEFGVEVFVLGLLIIAVSGIAMTIYVKKISDSLKRDVDKSGDEKNSYSPDSLVINQREEEIKNVSTRLEIENLKLELVNLKLEVAIQKLEQTTGKKNIDKRSKNAKEF